MYYRYVPAGLKAKVISLRTRSGGLWEINSSSAGLEAEVWKILFLQRILI